MSKNIDDALGQISQTVQSYAMLEPADRVLVAVSGGPDSMCLLHALIMLGYPAEVAHFDHQTRNGESAADAEFVRDSAERLSLPFHTDSRPVEVEAKGSGQSFEEYARRVRYEFLCRTARARGCHVIATGHNADDVAETLLLRLIRGASPKGLAGIPPVGQADGARVVRPLIQCRRQDIIAYLDAHKIAYRTDQSNTDTRYTRNRIRHELLPLLETYNGQMREALLRLAELQRRDSSYLDDHAVQAFSNCVTGNQFVDRKAFCSLPPALQSRVVLMLAWAHGVDCDFERADAAVEFICRGGTDRLLDLGQGASLRNGREQTEITFQTLTNPFVGATDEVVGVAKLAIPGRTEAFGATYTAHYSHPSHYSHNWRQHCSPTRQVFDADLAGSDLAVRPWQPGDHFAPFGMTGHKKIGDYFTDIGLPPWERERALVLSGHSGILWVVGHAISRLAAVHAATERVLEITVDET